MESAISRKYQELWESLLDSDDGISGESYAALLSLGIEICPEFTKESARIVDATDGRFYMKGGAT